jgi:hypothetical protein
VLWNKTDSRYKNKKKKQRPNRYRSYNSNCSVWHSFLKSTLFLLVPGYHACVLWCGQCLSVWQAFLCIITLQNKHGNKLEHINITRFLGTNSYVSVSSRVRRNKHVIVVEIKTKCKIITQRWKKLKKKHYLRLYAIEIRTQFFKTEIVLDYYVFLSCPSSKNPKGAQRFEKMDLFRSSGKSVKWHPVSWAL